MSNIPGAIGALPGVYDDVETLVSGVAVPGGSRIVAMIGQGSTNEVIVASAQGGGLDGLNAAYTSNTGSDGRHFQLINFPLIENRTTIYKNGIPLNGIEGSIISTTTFSYLYDYILDITNGELLLQAAHIVDQGGTFYVPLTTNVGLGVINSLTLVDTNAPPEIWTVRCVGVQRNSMNQPIGGTAQFEAFGSVSGNLLDANGNPIIWQANNAVVSNGILSFSIVETQVSGTVVSPFVPGDGFTIQVASGVLVRGDSLSTNEIPVANINIPTQTQGMTSVVNQFGQPSTSNNLSLGAQLAYANNASSLICLQAAPPLPRRTSYVLDPSVNQLSTNVDDFIFPFPIGVVPDINDSIHVFVTNPTSQVETQLLPNQFPYYTLQAPPFETGTVTLSQFIFSNLQPPAGYSFDYTVINSFEDIVTGFDGYIGRLPAFRNQAVFSSPSVTFDSSYVGQVLAVIDSNNKANIGTFNITGVSGGQLTFQTISYPAPSGLISYNTPTNLPDFTTELTLAFELIYIPTGLPLTGYSGTDGTLVALINTATGTFHSGAVNFNTVANLLLDYRLQINGSLLGNDGLYDLTGYNAGTNTLTIAMSFVSESDLRYEVWNTTLESTYLVLNHNVVPNGNQLRVTIVDTRDATFFDAGWINALAALETIECDILVPLPNQTISVIFQNALSHCLSMSNIVNRKERVLFIGAIQGLTPANLEGTQLAAVENIGVLEGIQGATVTDVLNGNIEDLANYSVPNAYGETYRCVYFYPDQIVVQAGADNVLIDGFYIAAAAAGYENADLSLQNPITNKVFSGFTILSNKMFSTLTLTQLAAAGVTTLQPVAGGGRVVWGITTSQSGFPEEQEVSIVFIRDRLAKTLRAGLQGFIGTPSSPQTGIAINATCVVLLNSLVSQGLITLYKGLSVVQDSVDPRQWDVSVSVQPSYPVNWIYIKVSVGNLTATGT